MESEIRVLSWNVMRIWCLWMCFTGRIIIGSNQVKKRSHPISRNNMCVLLMKRHFRKIFGKKFKSKISELHCSPRSAETGLQIKRIVDDRFRRRTVNNFCVHKLIFIYQLLCQRERGRGGGRISGPQLSFSTFCCNFCNYVHIPEISRWCSATVKKPMWSPF